MKFFLLVCLCVALAIPSISGKACDPLKGLGANPDCDSKKEMYCVNTNADTVEPTPSFNCVECVNSCDCAIGKYCSSRPGKVGKCLNFEREGKSCRPLTDNQLENPDIPEDWKCADLYTLTGDNTTYVDQAGVCSKGDCKSCDYTGNSNFGLDECGVDDGKGSPRVCLYPGILVETHKSIWHPNAYYFQRVPVWNAIFFPFFMIVIGIQVAILLIQFMRWRRGGGSNGSGIEMSSKGSKHDTKRDTANNNERSTITPSGYDNPPNNSTPPSYDQANSNNSRPGSSQIQYLKEEDPS